MVNRFLEELRRRNPALYRFGWAMLALYVIAGVLYFIDDRMIMGVNAWVKPMKFSLSILLYSWTFGWMLDYLKSEPARRWITWGAVLTMSVEIFLICLQAARGTTSHFNVHTAFDGAVFGIMGFFIALNTLINLYAAFHFVTGRTILAGPDLLAWQAGLILLLLGNVSGGWMVATLAHTVGAPDGGPGLPFLNWSTVAGDIRAAHFATLHGLQVFPLSTYVLSQLRPQQAALGTRILVGLYFAGCLYLHVLAWQGIPVIPIV
ncbi:MAG: hypothetical protein JNN04_11055 [Cyclobacteriaceae bacterium]|nr:hypothetical protein [Cyclobacteriaceae bacterium]